ASRGKSGGSTRSPTEAGRSESGRLRVQRPGDRDSILEPTGKQPYAELNHPTLSFLPSLRLRCAIYLGGHSGKLDGSALLVLEPSGFVCAAHGGTCHCARGQARGSG